MFCGIFRALNNKVRTTLLRLFHGFLYSVHLPDELLDKINKSKFFGTHSKKRSWNLRVLMRQFCAPTFANKGLVGVRTKRRESGFFSKWRQRRISPGDDRGENSLLTSWIAQGKGEEDILPCFSQKSFFFALHTPQIVCRCRHLLHPRGFFLLAVARNLIRHKKKRKHEIHYILYLYRYIVIHFTIYRYCVDNEALNDENKAVSLTRRIIY